VRLDPVGRRQHPLLVLLERRRHVAFRAGQRLPPLVVARHQVLVGVGDLDEIAEHAVEADLERLDPGARALARLHLRDQILAPVAQRAQLVELRVGTRPHRRLVA
jgi:hypothetical protein